MNIIYKITYLPHIGTDYPKYYIGSKYKYKRKYFGSVTSSKIFEFTNGLSLKQWWRTETSTHPENFIFEILEDCGEDITTNELVEIELEYQKKLDITTDEWFNQSFACGHFVSSLKDADTKQKMSDATKRYWASEEGQKKKERLRESNKKSKSKMMKELWETDSKFRRTALELARGPRTESFKEKMSKNMSDYWRYKKEYENFASE